MAIALDTLAYARRLREAGFSESQAEGQAEALAAAMTDTLATKQELRELELRMEAGFAAMKESTRELELRMNARFEHVEKQMDARFAEVGARFGEQTAQFRGELADLERRLTMRLGTVTVAAVTVVSAIVKFL